MKIIIEPTTKDQYAQRVELETYCDHQTMDEVASLFFQACVAYGFHPHTVSQYVNCELSEVPESTDEDLSLQA